MFYKDSIADLKNLNPRRWHQTINRLGSRERRPPRTEPFVPNLFGMRDGEKASEGAKFLSDGTLGYNVLNLDEFREQISNLPIDSSFRVTVEDVTKILKEMKVPNGCALGDLRKQVNSKFYPLIAIPLTDVYNVILTKKKWPLRWKIEITFFINKPKHTESLGRLETYFINTFLF